MIRFNDPISGFTIDVQQYQWGYREGTEYLQRVWGETGAGVQWRERIPYRNRWQATVRFAGSRDMAEKLRTLTYLVMHHGNPVQFFPDLTNTPSTFRWVDWPQTFANAYVADWRHEIELELRESLTPPPTHSFTVVGLAVPGA